MSYVIRVVACAGYPRLDRECAGKWIASYDIDAHDGRGIADLTANKAHAQRFATMEAALAAWRTQSSVTPLRDDGKPNRPLTAYTVEIERDEVSEVQA